jgi:phosphoheptose isomerase
MRALAVLTLDSSFAMSTVISTGPSAAPVLQALSEAVNRAMPLIAMVARMAPLLKFIADLLVVVHSDGTIQR